MPEIDVKQAYVDLGQGVLVERDVFDIARRVHEYDSNLRVQFLNDTDITVSEPPYRIVEHCKDGIDRPVFAVWTLNETVIQRIYAADNQKWDVLGRLDKTNDRARQVENHRYREVMAEAKEITAAVVASNKDTYTVPESIVLPGDRGDASKNVIFRSTPGPRRTETKTL